MTRCIGYSPDNRLNAVTTNMNAFNPGVTCSKLIDVALIAPIVLQLVDDFSYEWSQHSLSSFLIICFVSFPPGLHSVKMDSSSDAIASLYVWQR